MSYIEGRSREQSLLLPESLDDYVPEHHVVRVIDAYVDQLGFKALGFNRAEAAVKGRPPYHPGDLLKLYIYGYMHRTRSSRELEKQTRRNVEVMWLLKGLTPDHKTIADFRRANGDAIRQVNRDFVRLCRTLELVDDQQIGIDGSKFKAVNSRSRHVNKRKLKDKLDRIDKRINSYLEELDKQDAEDAREREIDPAAIEEALKRLRENQQKTKAQQQQLEDSEDDQICMTDKDARAMRAGRHQSVIGYNVQIAVDTKNKLILAIDATNECNDRNQLYSMAEQARAILDVKELEVIADSGYSSENQVAKCAQDGILATLAKQQSNCNAKRGLYTKEQFVHDRASDSYRCPQGQTLTYRSQSNHHGRPVKLYRSDACKACTKRHLCTTNKQKGREISRGIHEELLEEAHRRFTGNRQMRLLRHKTVEHPFGTLKRAWQQDHFLMKGLKNIKTECGLSGLAYNLTRVINILGVPKLLGALT